MLCSLIMPRVLEHALLAALDELADAVLLDVALAGEAELALDLDLDPQPLAVEAVLPALVVAGHGLVALIQVLVGPPPGVVHAHRVVGGDRPVDKRPLLVRVLELLAQLLERVRLVPELEHAPLDAWKVRFVWNRPIHTCFEILTRAGRERSRNST